MASFKEELALSISDVYLRKACTRHKTQDIAPFGASKLAAHTHTQWNHIIWPKFKMKQRILCNMIPYATNTFRCIIAYENGRKNSEGNWIVKRSISKWIQYTVNGVDIFFVVVIIINVSPSFASLSLYLYFAKCSWKCRVCDITRDINKISSKLASNK